jgi:short subunit dehydrogenase-like uncharacterized protein
LHDFNFFKGASGYTGKYTVYEAVKVLEGLSWGVAGRNKEKLESTLAQMGKKADTDLSKTPIVIADVNDEKSLVEMAKQAKIIVNCCGPYRHWGEQVVKACIEAGTHHVDVSGEPQYMETMQLKYNDQARQKGIYIVSACGFDSIPAEMGTIFLQEKFNGTVNSVETYLYSYPVDKTIRGVAGIHYGTYESAVYGLTHANELSGIRRQLFPTRLPRFSPQLKDRSIIHRGEVVRNRWCLPFAGSDRSVVMRSQRYFFEKDNQRPIQMRAYIAFGSLMQVIVVAFLGSVFGLFTKTSFTRRLLLNHPKFFTLGFVTHEGPKEELNENVMFTITFYGEGWKEKLSESNEEFPMPINKKMITKVSALNPGYGATCVALLLSATTILRESSKMPEAGGVFPPGAAFKNTSMIEELQKNGWKFEVIKSEE